MNFSKYVSKTLLIVENITKQLNSNTCSEQITVSTVTVLTWSRQTFAVTIAKDTNVVQQYRQGPLLNSDLK